MLGALEARLACDVLHKKNRLGPDLSVDADMLRRIDDNRDPQFTHEDVVRVVNSDSSVSALK
jgi:hypothetical protein